MTFKNVIIRLHELSLQNYGGSKGIRDEGLLDSALARPYQVFNGEELYKTVFEKAAAISESIIANHPFIDGNKRTGYLAMLLLLKTAGFKITANNDDIYTFIISISTSESKFEHITQWLRANTKPI